MAAVKLKWQDGADTVDIQDENIVDDVMIRVLPEVGTDCK